MAQANATAIQGENDARIDVTRSNAKLREQEAEAQRIATAAEKVQSAKALEESYSAERAAEEARAAREKATLEADIIVKTEVEKRRIELEAEAQAEQIRRKARGEADAIYMRMEAEARGAQEMLIKQADGFTQVVAAAGNPSDALRLMLADKMEALMQIQVDAIKNIKIDKVTVWDGANGEKSATANFLSGIVKSIPPMQELFDMAGMQLPSYLGTPKAEEAPAAAEVTAE